MRIVTAKSHALDSTMDVRATTVLQNWAPRHVTSRGDQAGKGGAAQPHERAPAPFEDVAAQPLSWHDSASLQRQRGIAANEDTMLLRYWIAMATCCLFALGSFAQDKSAPKTSPLEPVAWFVGGTWVADPKDPQTGKATHIDNRITWAPNHQAIEFLVKFDNEAHYNGFYAYDAASKTIKFFYTSSDGALTVGTCTPEDGGKTLTQEFDITGRDGSVTHLRSSIVRDGDNAYHFTVFMMKNGAWSPELKVDYQRK